MMFMHVLMVELLCQAAMGRIPALKCLLLGAWGANGCVLSCLTLNGLSIQGLRLLGSLARPLRSSGVLSWGTRLS
jgi:hypothetical protein